MKNIRYVVNEETLLDINGDHTFSVSDATELKKFLAEFEAVNPTVNTAAFKWHKAEYESIYPEKQVTVIDKEAYDAEEMVIDSETITIKRPIYKSGYDEICNDCDMVLRWDNGKAYTMKEIGAHLSSHTNTNQLPVTREGYLARYYVDAYGQQRPIGPHDTRGIGITLRDENGKLYQTVVYYDESLPLYHGNGSNGSYRYSYSDRIPTGEYEEITIPAKVPVYKSGEAYVATATGEVLYYPDGVAWTSGELGWFIERRAQEGYDNGLRRQDIKDYVGIIEKQWTDKIPTGEFTDTPLEGCYHYETVHHDAVTHVETVPDYDAEPTVKIVKEAGYYPVD